MARNCEVIPEPKLQVTIIFHVDCSIIVLSRLSHRSTPIAKMLEQTQTYQNT